MLKQALHPPSPAEWRQHEETAQMTPQPCIVGWAHTPFGKLDALDTEALLDRKSVV